MFPKERFDAAAEEVDRVFALAEPSGPAVLDLACGPGRHAVAIAQQGCQVTGVDRTRYLLNKARARARSAGVKIDWVQADMRDFLRPDSFDLVLSMFTSFGYFDDKDEDLRVLGNIFTSLHPEGVCFMDMMGKEVLARVAQPTRCEELPDGGRLVQQFEIFDGWSRVRNEWLVIRKGRVRTFRFYHTVYSGQELLGRMHQAGFSDIRLYGNLEGREYGRDAERLIAVARKAG